MDYLKQFSKGNRSFSGNFPILSKISDCSVGYVDIVQPIPRESFSCALVGLLESPGESTSFYDGYTIEVRYSNNSGPCQGGHSCNAARFRLLGNGVLIGVADLNNDPGGGDRDTSLTINSELARQIRESSPNNNILQLSLVCDIRPDENGGWGLGKCHENVTWIRVYSENDPFNYLYDGCPIGNFLELYPQSDTQSYIKIYYESLDGKIIECYRPPIAGCTNPYRENYNPNAEILDDSCGDSILHIIDLNYDISDIIKSDNGFSYHNNSSISSNIKQIIYSGNGTFRSSNSSTSSNIKQIIYSGNGTFRSSNSQTENSLGSIFQSSDGIIISNNSSPSMNLKNITQSSDGIIISNNSSPSMNLKNITQSLYGIIISNNSSPSMNLENITQSLYGTIR